MVGGEQNHTSGDYGTGVGRASETTSINLTPVHDEPTIVPKLSPEERAAVEALALRLRTARGPQRAELGCPIPA